MFSAITDGITNPLTQCSVVLIRTWQILRKTAGRSFLQSCCSWTSPLSVPAEGLKDWGVQTVIEVLNLSPSPDWFSINVSVKYWEAFLTLPPIAPPGPPALTASNVR